MNEENRLKKLQTIHRIKSEIHALKLGIGHEIKEIEESMEVVTNGDSSSQSYEQKIKELRKLMNNRRKAEARRSDYNAKIKTLDSDFEKCLWGRGDDDEAQMEFHYDIEDVQGTTEEIIKTKVEKKKKSEGQSAITE